MDNFSSLTKQLHKRRNLLASTAKTENVEATVDKRPQNSSYQNFIEDVKSIDKSVKCPPLDMRFQETRISLEDDSKCQSAVSHYHSPQKNDGSSQSAKLESDEDIKPIPIYSAGTVRSRYRDLKKSEEKKTSQKHMRTYKKHTAALKREAGSSTDELSRENVTVGDPPDTPGAEETPDLVQAFCAYPQNTEVVDGLVYSKYCTDTIFKNGVLARVRRALQLGNCVLLRSQWLNDSMEGERQRDASLSGIRIAGQSVSVSRPEDVLREAKQVLKSVFMACMQLTGHSFPPPIEEATRGGLVAYLEMLIYSKTHPDRPP